MGIEDVKRVYRAGDLASDPQFVNASGTLTQLSDFAQAAFGGPPSDYDVDVSGNYVEARLDWYHRLDERIAARKLLSGYGVSLVYRDAKVDGATASFLGATGAPGTIEIPS